MPVDIDCYDILMPFLSSFCIVYRIKIAYIEGWPGELCLAQSTLICAHTPTLCSFLLIDSVVVILDPDY